MEEHKNITTYKSGLKDRILKVAIEAFKTHGIKAVKMDQIAQMLGISKRTLYEIYDNKEELLRHAMQKAHEKREKEIAEALSGCDNVMDIVMCFYRYRVEELRTVNPLFYADMDRYPKVLEYLDRINRRNRQSVMGFVQRGIDEGYFRRDIDYQLMLDMTDVLNRHFRDNQYYRKYPVEHIFHNMLFMTFRGFCTLNGIRILDDFLSAEGK